MASLLLLLGPVLLSLMLLLLGLLLLLCAGTPSVARVVERAVRSGVSRVTTGVAYTEHAETTLLHLSNPRA